MRKKKSTKRTKKEYIKPRLKCHGNLRLIAQIT